jgi:mRNA deadenylase 3'-5' endonuclease subunit Ccr4
LPKITIIPDGEDINKTFSILTLNVMGICRKLEQTQFAKLRAVLLKKEILKNPPDILCFQEMSQEFLNYFYIDEIKEIYKYVYENPIVIEKKPDGKLIKDIDCCIFSKFKPTRVIMQNLNGVLDYRNTLQIIEFKNLVIYKQGQKHHMDNYLTGCIIRDVSHNILII